MKLPGKPIRRLESNPAKYVLKRHLSASTTYELSEPQRSSGSKSHNRQADRDLLVDVLSSSATKRDAKSYLSRYLPQKPNKAEPLRDRPSRNDVNLGRLFPQLNVPRPATATASGAAEALDSGLHRLELKVAIIVLRSVGEIDDDTLKGAGNTFAQLSRLGLGCLVIVDDDCRGNASPYTHLERQLDRVVGAIESSRTVRVRKLDKLFYRKGPMDPKAASVEPTKLNRIYEALEREAVVVASPLIYGEYGDVFGVNSNGAALSLAYAFRHGKASDFGLTSPEPLSQSTSAPASPSALEDHTMLSLDRIIIIDPRGGLPHISRGSSHVFVNLEQEFEDIHRGLQSLLQDRGRQKGKVNPSATDGLKKNDHDPDEEVSAAAATLSDADINSHLGNLLLTRGALALLPSTSSALIATPAAAAFSANMQVTGVGTRPQRNPLIHNLLTDKPLFSSSLPRKRLSASDTRDIPTNHPSMIDAPPTHIKHGMPVTVTPDPASRRWTPPQDTTFSISLDDPRIDQKRLVALIEDSFGRSLDVEDYFRRIRPRLAGIIVAGDYDGGAILTWEQPQSFQPTEPTAASGKPDRLVPYLDKFAVLKRAQGGGVADVVFSVMVQRCFPAGVCWRSRNGNPVNKWYFERSRGSLRLPHEPGAQGWTMFWTTENLQPGRLQEYAEVCLAVKSSWADGRNTLD